MHGALLGVMMESNEGNFASSLLLIILPFFLVVVGCCLIVPATSHADQVS